MKTTLFSTALMLSFILSALGQQIPKGVYVAQPSSDGWRILVYWTEKLVWPNASTFEAEITETGHIKEMNFTGGSHDMGTSFEFNFPSENANTAFKDVEVWKKFAIKIHQSFAVLTHDVYVDKLPFVFIGRSVVVDHWETPDGLASLVFKKGERLLSISVASWRGPLPVQGESVFVGQNGRGEFFFPAHMKDREWQMSEEMRKQLSETAKN